MLLLVNQPTLNGAFSKKRLSRICPNCNVIGTAIRALRDYFLAVL
jgi:hypothetical protein